MPTGVAIRDPRGQLFDAAERVLLRDGPGALTSRAVTAEAGVAKGVLHRHFADFDAFLVDLTLARIARITEQAAGLRAAAGTGPSQGTWPPSSRTCSHRSTWRSSAWSSPATSSAPGCAPPPDRGSPC